MNELGLNPEEMEEHQEKLYETLKFFTKFLAAGLVFQFILYVYPNTVPVQSAFADLTAYILNIFMVNQFIANGISIAGSGTEYIITQDCLGWKSMAAFIALVFASTKRTVEHLNYIIMGLGIIAVANIIRVVTTVYLSEIGVISFGVIHGLLWKWSLTALVLGMWIIWLKDYKDAEKFTERIQNYSSELKKKRGEKLE